MPVKQLLMLGLLLLIPSAHAAEADDPSLEVIEMLGELDEEAIELDIAMSEISEKINEKSAAPQEVKHEE